ncbi:MAG TPA: S8 family serine peptidase [Longimicrobiales bacterium]
MVGETGKRRNGILLFFLLLLASAPLQAQAPQWVVYDTAIVARAALQRRIEQTGAQVRYASRLGPAISVDAQPQQFARIRAIRGVRRLQPVQKLYARAPGVSPFPRFSVSPISRNSAQADFDSAFYGPNWRAIRQLGVPAAHRLGFTGAGVRIAIIDTGFEPAHEALSTRRVTAQRDFIQGDNIVSNGINERTDSLDQEIHGTWVWSVMGGHKPGMLVGPAYDASFILAKVDVTQVGLQDFAADEDRWVRAVEWADTVGARIINSSISFRDFVDRQDYAATDLNGDIAIATQTADALARRGILVVNAVGEGTALPTTLEAPADADSIIAVGAVDSIGNPAVFRNGLTTARGPTIDGRLKPELVATGINLVAARSSNILAYDTAVEGTSLSTALVTGGAAMFMQAWPSLSMMAVRNALLQSGTRSAGPDNVVGFGVPNIASAIFLPEGLLPARITGTDLENTLTTLQPTFTWIAPLRHPNMSALYRLEVATDPAFTNIVYTDTVRDVTSLTVKRPLQPAPVYHWRVIAESGTDVRRVIDRPALPFRMPDWVRLITLNNPTGNFPTTTRPTFQWEPLAAPSPIGPLIYDLQIINAQSGAIVQSLNNLSTATVVPTTPLLPNIPYRWRVIVRTQIPGVADTVNNLGTVVVSTNEQPPATLLYQNFPNPFPRPDLGVSETQIWFDVTTATTVNLAVYDLRGRLVRTLIPADASCGEITLQPGQYGRAVTDTDPCVRTRWDGKTAGGDFVTRGVYILRLRANGEEQVKRIVYMPD